VKAEGSTSGVPFADVLRRANVRLVSGPGSSEATFGEPEPKVSHSLPPTHEACSRRKQFSSGTARSQSDFEIYAELPANAEITARVSELNTSD
jgi:hypothetical protein